VSAHILESQGLRSAEKFLSSLFNDRRMNNFKMVNCLTGYMSQWRDDTWRNVMLEKRHVREFVVIAQCHVVELCS
jgi:hypothetical protein